VGDEIEEKCWKRRWRGSIRWRNEGGVVDEEKCWATRINSFYSRSPTGGVIPRDNV